MASKDYRTKLKNFQNTFKTEISDISKKQNKDLGVSTDIFKKQLASQPGGEEALAKLNDTSSAKTSDVKQIRSNMLSRNSAVKQASAEINPQYDQILSQLKESIASTRQSIPQTLSSRGQSMGGLRSSQEQGLSRTQAYQTADIDTQRAGAIQSRATDLVSANQASIAAEQARQDALTQQNYQNQLSERTMQLQEQGFTADEAYRQATLDLSQQQFGLQQTTAEQDQANIQRQFDENVRQFGLEYAQQQQQIDNAQAARMAAASGGTGTTGVATDLTQYRNNLANLTGQAKIDYINNLQARGLDTYSVNTLKAEAGITPEVTTTQQVKTPLAESITSLPSMTDLSRGNVGTVGQNVTTPETIIGQTETEPELGLQDAQSFIDSSDLSLMNDKGVIIGTDTAKLESILDSMYLNGQINWPSYQTLAAKYGLEL